MRREQDVEVLVRSIHQPPLSLLFEVPGQQDCSSGESDFEHDAVRIVGRSDKVLRRVSHDDRHPGIEPQAVSGHHQFDRHSLFGSEAKQVECFGLFRVEERVGGDQRADGDPFHQR